MKPAPATKNQLILVDSNNACIGYSEKLTCHQNEGLLHRAFSVLLFNSRGELLLQKRSHNKMLWPNYWSNSCCSHPRRDENILAAAQRRITEELGLRSALYPVYEFQYFARYENVGAEREFCSVLVGITDDKAKACPDEVSELRYIEVEELDIQIKNKPEQFTPWFIMEWRTLRDQYWNQVEELITTKVAC
ncbi:MAG: isopentenyl-diphosphate Delta-isomerase [Pseudomonadales bacterium]|nr:isopentenyl-diphosphate Delta-isomerase [Pseudomonadales bacterium]